MPAETKIQISIAEKNLKETGNGVQYYVYEIKDLIFIDMGSL